MALFIAQSLPAQKKTPLPDLPKPGRVFRAAAPGQPTAVADDANQQPPSAPLASFGFSADGNLLFLFAHSDKVEVRDLQTGHPEARYQATRLPAVDVITNSVTGGWVLVQPNGVLRFVSARTGETSRTVDTGPERLGRRIRKVLVAPDESWVAYANGEDGKILDLWNGMWQPKPRVVADLGDAQDIALSPDGAELWAVDRDQLSGYAIPGGRQIGTARLPPAQNPNSSRTITIVNGSSGAVAFIGTRNGILRYSLAALTSRKISRQPANGIYSAGSGGPVLAVGTATLRSYGVNGARQCEWQMAREQNYSQCRVSRNGQWLGCLGSGKVDVWSTKSLSESCRGGH